MSKRYLITFLTLLVAVFGLWVFPVQSTNAKDKSRDAFKKDPPARITRSVPQNHAAAPAKRAVRPAANRKSNSQNIVQGGGPVTISGTVKDGSGHGWPLYAEIDIDNGGGTVFTNPVTGAYSVVLNSAVNYGFDITAVTDAGYAVLSESHTYATSTTQNFALLAGDPASGSVCPQGYGIVGGVAEGFPTTDTPANWTIIDNAATGGVWVFDDPGGHGNTTGGDGGFAMIDSDNAGFIDIDTELRTPALNLSTQATVILSFDTEFNWYDFGNDEKGDVDVSSDGGSTWTNVLRYQGGDVLGPHHEDLDISTIAGNQANVMARFHYYDANFEFWWEVDNVVIGAPVCQVVAGGGLLAGFVTDVTTTDGIVGAKVTSDEDNSITATTLATPDDAQNGDGLYVLFSSLTGSHPFTATKSQYSDASATPNIAANNTTGQNFALGSGHFVVTPPTIETTVQLGDTDTQNLAIQNDGTGPADYELQEGKDLSTLHLAKKQNPVIRIPGHFSPLSVAHALKTGELKALQPKKKPSISQDAPWTDITDYPSAIMDNAASEIDGKIYSVGGFDGANNLSSGVVYDPGAATWTPIASMSEIREKPVSVAIDGKMYVTGGWDSVGNPDAILEIYDPASDSWTTGADLPVPRSGAAAVAFDGKFYVIGGCDAGTCGFTEVQVYDPAGDAWTSAADYPEGVSWEACGAIGDLIYCAGGTGGSGDSAHTFSYDPASDTWSPLADMPNTQWGSSFIAANGLLYASGGIVAGNVSNEGASYDPASDSWTAIAPSNNATYRRGSACGLYSLGGTTGFFTPIPNSEVLPDVSDCGGTTDIPWLSEDPASGTVPNGTTTNVDINFDTSVLTQPGDYFAHLKVKENTPGSVPDVNVILHIPLPAGWGFLDGTVTGLARCDGPGAPLNKASVFVDTAGTDFTLETDSSGHYVIAFLATDGPATVTISAPGYVTQVIPNVVMSAGGTVTKDAALRLDAPCASKSPTSFDVTLATGGQMDQTLTLTNDGAGALTYTALETTFPQPPQIRKPFPVRKQTAKPTTIGPKSYLSMKGSSKESVLPAVSSLWFFGVPLPGGSVHYGHAQCEDQPNSFYVISGVDNTFSVTDSFARYDAATNDWVALAPIPTAVESGFATCYQGKIYAMGGSFDGASASTDMFIYDIASDTWAPGAALPRGILGAAAAGWNGQIFAIGGDDDFSFGGTSTEVDVYDIASDTWVGTATPMPIATTDSGFFQAGQNLYIVGGFDDGFPTDVAASLRYDLSTDTWTTGPDLGNPRADIALAATSVALYAIGGDATNGGPFDASNIVERLDLSAWPAGGWTTESDPLPLALTANNAGFCTEVLKIGGSTAEFWSTGGFDGGAIHGDNAFHPVNEHCFSIFSDVPWLSESPASGTVAPDSSSDITVHFDATGLAAGDYSATIVINNNDPGASRFNIPVTLHVTPCLLCEEFDAATPPTGWTYKNTFTESGGVLAPVKKKKSTAIATPVFAGCTTCTVSTSLTTTTNKTKTWLYGWETNDQNRLELQMNKSKVILSQRSANHIVKKTTVNTTAVAVGTAHTVSMAYDGTNVVVIIDGTTVIPTFAPVGALPTGTVGLGIKGIGSFDYMHVN